MFCAIGCDKNDNKPAKKPYVITITDIVSTSELPTKNFQANNNGYKDVKMYVDESKKHIYLRFNEGSDNDELVRFDKD